MLRSGSAIDLDRFVRRMVEVRNLGGGRGYESGIRVFNCPICQETRGRGWVGVSGWGAGCFNIGCDAEPQLDGGALEWARRVMKLGTRAETWRALERDYGGGYVPPLAPARRGSDWCRLPETMRPFQPDDVLPGVPLARPEQGAFLRFVERQWGLGVADALRWELGWCLTGRHAWRVIIPIRIGGQLVAFQARHVNDRVQPKYKTSEHGAEGEEGKECGRPAAALMFNVDAVRPGEDAVLVEGAGDVMGWSARAGRGAAPAVALLGTALTPAKLAMLAASRVGRVVVALDAEPRARRRAAAHVEDLRERGLDATMGDWAGAKDAGAGARLDVSRAWTLADAVRARLPRP